MASFGEREPRRRTTRVETDVRLRTPRHVVASGEKSCRSEKSLRLYEVKFVSGEMRMRSPHLFLVFLRKR